MPLCFIQVAEQEMAQTQAVQSPTTMRAVLYWQQDERAPPVLDGGRAIAARCRQVRLELAGAGARDRVAGLLCACTGHQPEVLGSVELPGGKVRPSTEQCESRVAFEHVHRQRG